MSLYSKTWPIIPKISSCPWNHSIFTWFTDHKVKENLQIFWPFDHIASATSFLSMSFLRHLIILQAFKHSTFFLMTIFNYVLHLGHKIKKKSNIQNFWIINHCQKLVCFQTFFIGSFSSLFHRFNPLKLNVI